MVDRLLAEEAKAEQSEGSIAMLPYESSCSTVLSLLYCYTKNCETHIIICNSNCTRRIEVIRHDNKLCVHVFVNNNR